MHKSLIIYIFLLFPVAAKSACSQDTVQFYLDKGFNQEQITQLCREAQSEPTYQPYQKPVVIYQQGIKQGNTAEESKAINKLNGGIAGRSIDITDTHIKYIASSCFRAGNSPEIDQRAIKCIDVAYSIAREGLKVKESGQKFGLFGNKQLKVISSDIQRKHVTADPWAQFPADLRYQFQAKYENKETGNETVIPVLENASITELANAIKVVAAATTTRLADDDKSEVERILDDSYVAPSEEEYLVSRPEPIEEPKEKKKRWWNPFD